MANLLPKSTTPPIPTAPTTTIREAADLLGISHSSAYAAARAGSFPAPVIKIGGRYVVPTRPLLELLGLVDASQEVA